MNRPHLVQLSIDGTLTFFQDPDYIRVIRNTEDTIDCWVVQHTDQYKEIMHLQRIFIKYNRMDKIVRATKRNLKVGTQIIYVPNHVKVADIMHTDIQFGFVTSVKKDAAFCRFYSTYDMTTLRTTLCSELAMIDNLYLLRTMDDSWVQYWLEIIEKADRQFGVYMDEVIRRLDGERTNH